MVIFFREDVHFSSAKINQAGGKSQVIQYFIMVSYVMYLGFPILVLLFHHGPLFWAVHTKHCSYPCIIQKRSCHSEKFRTMGQPINNSKSSIASSITQVSHCPDFLFIVNMLTLPWILGPTLLNDTISQFFKKSVKQLKNYIILLYAAEGILLLKNQCHNLQGPCLTFW